MKIVSLIVYLSLSLLSIGQVAAQKTFGTRNGQVIFQSPSDEDVKAINNEVSSRLLDNGTLSLSLLIKGFKFKMAEMQDHFNTQYLQSTQFPRADFTGSVTNIKSVNFAKDGSYPVQVTGNLTLHGVTQKVSASGTIVIAKGKPLAKANFPIVIRDFGVNAPDVTEKVTIVVSCQYQ